jgi:hypothetical protein
MFLTFRSRDLPQGWKMPDVQSGNGLNVKPQLLLLWTTLEQKTEITSLYLSLTVEIHFACHSGVIEN